MSDPDQNILDDLDNFDDIFHDYGDDLDENEDVDMDFLPYFTNPSKNAGNDDSKDAEPIDLEFDLVKDKDTEQQLSQKLSQLSASNEQATTTAKRPLLTPSSPVSIMKKLKTDIIDPLQTDEMPDYLLDKSKAFEKYMNPYLTSNTTNLTMEDLRQVAFLQHKLALIKLHISLWTTYLHSGTGQLLNVEESPWQIAKSFQLRATRAPLCIWPEKLKSIIPADQQANVLNYVTQKIRQLRTEHLSYKTQLNKRKDELKDHFTSEIDEKINKFVQDYGMTLRRIIIESQIVIIKYDYYDQLFLSDFKHELHYADQIKIFEDLCESKLNKETAKMEVDIFKQRVIYHHYSDLFTSVRIPEPQALTTVQNHDVRQRLIYRYEELLERTKADMLMIYIRTAEAKMEEYTQKFDSDYERFEQQQRTFFRRSSDGQKLDLNRRSNFSYVNCSPTVFQNVSHHLSYEQLQFLNRGPSYIIPCQMHLLSKSSTLPQITTKQIMPLRRQLTTLFKEYQVDNAYQNAFRRNMEQEFVKSFTPTIPIALQKRVFYEKELIQSIRYQLAENQLILRRTSDEYNTYYLGDRNEFQAKSLEYMEENVSYYETIGVIDEFYSEEKQMDEIIKNINRTLHQLELKDLISMNHQRELQIRDKTQMKLPYLYFLPEPHQNGDVCVRPRLSSCKDTPIYKIATYLDQILRPLYEKYAQATRLMNGFDFIQKLQQFTEQNDYFTSNTRFITYEIHNLSTRVTHADLLYALNPFLTHEIHDTSCRELKLNGIIELVRLVLSNNVFTYDGKMYRYSQGGPMNLSLMELLTDIYLQYWQSSFVRRTRLHQGFYGRYHHTGILTWNRTDHELSTCILELNEQYPDIQLTISCDLHVHFLDAYIENLNGRLLTSVYHNRSKEQFFLLPYASIHPRLTHRQWFRFALVRAAQYCYYEADFQEERLQIELTLLANGYSLDFVKYHLQQFLHRFYPSQKSIYFNQSIYKTFRSQIFQYFNEQSYKFKEEEQQQPIYKERLIQLHYLFDWGSRYEFNKKFYHLWSTILNKDPNFQKLGLKVILTTKYCYLSNALLAQ